tara:strand:- start:3071 stop:3826 length:756 start_codon:yes stop_codon:yes gene_type:complete
MNKDIEIVLNTTDVVAAAFDVADGVVTVDGFSFQWKKIQKMTRTAAANAATGLITVTPATPTLGLEYRFTLVQYVADARREVAVSYTADAADVAAGVNSVVTKLKTLITAYVSGGSLDVTLGGSASTVQIYSTLTNPLINIGGLLNATATPALAGTAGVNMGAILASEGVKDSFDATVPTSGLLYTSWEFELMLPKGYGGFNHQTDDQAVSLMLFLDEGGTAYAALNTEILNVSNGLDPDGTAAEEILGQD